MQVYVLANVSLMDHPGTDPSRIIGQIVTGVGFLGAGVILQHEGSIQGLTTAATIWCSAALGTLAGLGLYWETLLCTLAIWIANTALKTDRFLPKTYRKTDEELLGEEEHNEEL